MAARMRSVPEGWADRHSVGQRNAPLSTARSCTANSRLDRVGSAGGVSGQHRTRVHARMRSIRISRQTLESRSPEIRFDMNYLESGNHPVDHRSSSEMPHSPSREVARGGILARRCVKAGGRHGRVLRSQPTYSLCTQRATRLPSTIEKGDDPCPKTQKRYSPPPF